MFKRIVCATDFSDTAETAWELAGELASIHRSELILVHVFTELPISPEVAASTVQQVWEEQRLWTEQQLAGHAEAMTRRGLATRFLLRTGTAAEEIGQGHRRGRRPDRRRHPRTHRPRASRHRQRGGARGPYRTVPGAHGEAPAAPRGRPRSGVTGLDCFR